MQYIYIYTQYTYITNPFKSIMIKPNYVFDVKYITTYTNYYTTRSQIAGIA